MAHPGKSCELVGLYSEALLDYLTGRREATLARARDLGRSALRNGLCASEMSAVHHDSIRRILAEMRRTGKCATDGEDGSDVLTAASAFLADSMSPFEARERELRRSNVALRYRNTRLEEWAQRFSQVVYNDAMQLLAAAQLATAAAANGAQPSVCDPLNEVQALLQQVQTQLASCSDACWPRVLDDLGLEAAIHSLTHAFSRTAELDIITDAAVDPLPPDIRLALYRAVLEALTNVVRHAKANRVTICVCKEPWLIRCSIRDDGIGFDVPLVLSGIEDHGSGLAYVSESLRLVGGTLTINSVPARGTEIRISILHRTDEWPD